MLFHDFAELRDSAEAGVEDEAVALALPEVQGPSPHLEQNRIGKARNAESRKATIQNPKP